MCDVVPMHAGHLLLGHPWKFDRRVIYDGYTNRYTFKHRGKNVTLAPLTPKQVYQDQLKLKEKIEKERDKKNEKKKEKIEGVEVKVREEQESQKEIESGKMSVFAREKEIRKSLLLHQLVLVLMYKECLFDANELDNSLPLSIVSLIQEFKDVFPEDLPSGLPPFRGIEHQIDFVPGATIPN